MITVSDLVVCMRDNVEAIGLQRIVTEGCDRGRPRFKISREQLIFLLEHGFTQSSIASMMGCSSRTVSRIICEFDLHAYTRFSDIEDQFVDMAV